MRAKLTRKNLDARKHFLLRIYTPNSASQTPECLRKNYMSHKIGAADSGIITIDQPAGLVRENIS